MKRWLRWRGGPWRRRRAAVVGLSLKYRPVIKAKPNRGYWV